MKRVTMAMLTLAFASVLMLATVGSAFAATTTNADVPLSGSITNACNAETVTYTGSAHLLVHSTTDSAGGQHADVHVNIHVTGTGATTGAAYVVNETDTAPSINLTNGAGEQTASTHFEVIGQGQAPNFRIDGLEHITVNANGTVTVSFFNLTTSCQ